MIPQQPQTPWIPRPVRAPRSPTLSPSSQSLRPAVFLDKDGTLVHDVPYNVDPALVRLLGGARDGARLLRAAGYALVVGTNQSGVARGFFTTEQLGPVRARLEDLLGLPLDGFYWCPHHPAGHVAPYATTCGCRKPLPGLMLRAARELGIDLARSWMVGDILHDVEAGSRAGCRTALLLNGGETEWVTGPHRQPTLLAEDLADAAKSILDASRPARIKPHLVPEPPPPPEPQSLIEPLFPPKHKPASKLFPPTNKPASKLFPKPAIAPAVDPTRQPALAHSLRQTPTTSARRPAIAHSLLQMLDAFAGLRVLVIGEAMLDSYLDGHTERLCREAPVPVVDVTMRRDAPGGGANAAVNAAALGARVTLLSAVGDDEDATRLGAALERLGVRSDGLLRDPGRRTLLKQRVLAGGQILLRLDTGSTHDISADAGARLRARLRAAWCEADAVIVSDYGYGVLTPALIDEIAALQSRAERVLVADGKDLRRLAHVRPTAVKPNYAEAARLLGLEVLHGEARVAQIAAHEFAFLQRTGARIAAVTLDATGGLVFEAGQPVYRTYTRPSPDAHATGAGDTFVTALALALAAGASTPASADLASSAATVAVGRGGTTACTAAELRLHLTVHDKVLRADDFGALADDLHRAGKRVVFTNGCFDILHRGHITYLSHAKALGDVLIVGLNADASVRRLKGSSRPINSAADRAQVLAALSCVDHIVEFADDTPVALIERTRPDVYVKGGDYTLANLPEAALVERLGGQVRLLPYLPDFSTTGMLARMSRPGMSKTGTSQTGTPMSEPGAKSR